MNTTGAIGISISGSLMAKPVLSNMSLMGKAGAGAAYPDLAPVSAVAFIVGIVLVVLLRGKLYGSRTDRGPNDELLPPYAFRGSGSGFAQRKYRRQDPAVISGYPIPASAVAPLWSGKGCAGNRDNPAGGSMAGVGGVSERYESRSAVDDE